MCKVIALYNHKGGVSKTTTTFNLGWALADLGYKVGIVDLDPQCNLTALTLGLSDIEDFESFYEKKSNENIYEKINPIITGERIEIEPVRPVSTKNENLFLIAGNILLSDIDIGMTLGLGSSQYVNYSKQFVGALNSIIRETAKRNRFDYVLLDMSPSSGGMNRILLMGSDYFIIPTSPDFFCYQAIQILGNIIPKWHETIKGFRDPSIKNNLPSNLPKFLGIISQNYNKYRQRMAKSYREWNEKIQIASYEILAKTLKEYEMVISEDKFRKTVIDNSPYNIINVPNFQSLIGISQKESLPVFTLEKEHINRTGDVEKNMMDKVDEFKELFNNFAKIVKELSDD